MISRLFTPESPRPWAVMRIVLATALLWDAGNRWFYVVELYSTEGFLFPAFPASSIQPFAFGPLTTVILASLLVVLLGMLVIGWHSRFCAIVVLGLMAWFALIDAAATLTKYTAISFHLLLLMSFAQPGGVWSVDAWWRKRRQVGIPLASAWPRMLVRLLVASIYLGAAVTKIRLPDFATGDLLEFSLLDDAYGGRGIGLWLSTKPRLLILASYATITFELLFPFLIWVPQLRRGMLFLGVSFHLLLAAMMHLEIFSPVMIAALCAFLKESDLQAIHRLVARRIWNSFHKTPSSPIVKLTTSSVKWAGLNIGLFLLVATSSVAGLAYCQYQQNVYGVFHENEKMAFPDVASIQAYEMIDAYQPDYRDYFHRIEIGSRLGYRHTFGERARFRSGQVVFVIARLLQPHPSWELEWELIAPKEPGEDQPAIANYMRRLDASHSYTSIGFQLKPEFPSGNYVIRLSASERLGAKEVIVEIPFELIKDK